MSLWRPWSLRELAADLGAGRGSPTQATRHALARIGATDDDIRAWVVHDPNPSVTARGPLQGIPMGVKDIIDLAGFPTGCGSRLRAGAAPAMGDAAIVSAWRAAGASPLGKTVTTEFAFFTPGPTRNPARLHHTPGGSSSGSAAAVAAGQVPLAIGSQTAGSVTRPAAYCGVASLVMRHGRLPVDGVVGLSPSLDAHGVFAATASDLALAWSAVSGEPDVGDCGNAPHTVVWSGAELAAVSGEMASAVAAARARLMSRGGTADSFPLDRLISDVTAAHPVVMAYEAARERAAELARADRLSVPLARLLRTGAQITEGDYESARRVLAVGRAAVDRLLCDYEVILGPAAPDAAPPGHTTTGDPVFSRPWQALGLAAVAVPGLRDASGMPLGIQVIAGSELTALRAAVWVEQNLDR